MCLYDVWVLLIFMKQKPLEKQVPVSSGQVVYINMVYQESMTVIPM